MFYRLLVGLIFFLTCSSISVAFDLNNMTSADRETLQKEIKRYILENPDIIFEAANLVRKREAAIEIQRDKDIIQANFEEVFYDNYSYVGGNPDGDITLVEFVDYKCGYCRKASEIVHEFLKTDQNIRFVVKEFPILGDASLISSKFAIAVKNVGGPEKYKLVHDILLTLTADPSEAYLRKIATELELNPKQLFEAMESEPVLQEIARTSELARKLQVSGTPTFILDEQLLRGFVPLDVLLQLAETVRSE